MGEWNEMRTLGMPSRSAWREIPGHGVLELVAGAGGGSAWRVHPWCPWGQRPGLLGTFSCSRQLLFDGTAEVVPLGTGGHELVGFSMVSSGRLFLDGASALVLDSGGRPVAELADGESVWLEAGRFYLKAQPTQGREVLRIDALHD